MELFGCQIKAECNNKLIYDSNGFLTGSQLVFFDSENFVVLFSYTLLDNNNDYYAYNINIKEEWNRGSSIAYGKVELFLKNNKIDKVIVNNVENGMLFDKYNNCFNISPREYLHLIYKNYT